MTPSTVHANAKLRLAGKSEISHPDIDDLINVRNHSESITVADGDDHRCVAIGDLPIVTRDAKGRREIRVAS